MQVHLKISDPADEQWVQQRLAFHLHDLEAHLECLEIVIERASETHAGRFHVCRILGHADDRLLFDLHERQSRLDLALSRALERGARVCRRRCGRVHWPR